MVLQSSKEIKGFALDLSSEGAETERIPVGVFYIQ